MDKVIVDFLGIILGLVTTAVFYKTFWAFKMLNYKWFALGFSVVVLLQLTAVLYFQSTGFLPILSVLFAFAISFYFISRITYKLLLSLIIIAIKFASELVTGAVVVEVMGISVEQVQDNLILYMLGVLISTLFALFIVFMIRFFMRNNKQEMENQFNLLIALMPIQSMLLCLILYGYFVEMFQTDTLGIIAVIISLVLIFVIMFVINNQRKALLYKKEYEVAQFKLKAQIDHYQKLYDAQCEVRKIRHDIGNNLIAIFGFLENLNVQAAMEHIVRINADMTKAAEIVDTGFPPVDAIISAKINRANESEIKLNYKVLIDGVLHVDQFDLAMIVASALDNAIEGILRSEGVSKDILIHIATVVEYVSIYVENFTSETVYSDFRTSKSDKSSHGFGMAQIESIALKYSGTIQAACESDAGKFTLNILLKNQRP